jgi:hypothetical protein
MGKITGLGCVAGAIAWLGIMFYASTQVSCMQFQTCSGGDLVLFAIIGMGMLAPAWIVASIFSLFSSGGNS